MATDDGGRASSLSSRAPFVLRPLLDDVPLSEDGSKDDIKINCVDYLGDFDRRLSEP
jgi:hypothetical protein